MSGLVWVASYPKSGNTWFRVFLSNLLAKAGGPVSINALDEMNIVSARRVLDEAAGYATGELRPEEIEVLRCDFHHQLAGEGRTTVFWKIHDAQTRLPDGRPLVPPEGAALYFIRNPLDVCVSLTRANGHFDYGQTIRQMADPTACLGTPPEKGGLQVQQRLLTWSDHVRSWTGGSGPRVQVVRYEDMQFRAEETFGAAARFAGLPDAPERVRRAIEFSRFEGLRHQEAEQGFKERLPQTESFFREGRAGTWRGVLNPEQVRQLVADHGEVMRQFGYLDPQGEPVF